MDQRQIETTLAIADAMADELADYLMGDNLYRQLIVKTPTGVKQPKMTVGALLENVRNLEWEEAQLSGDQRRRLRDIKDRIALERGSFGAPWRTMLRREFKALLDSWRWYLDDAGRDPDARENYSREAHIRTRIDVVQEALAKDPLSTEYRRELSGLDARLRPMLHGGAYAGPSDYESRYPADQAWWLYGQPAGD